MHRFADNTEELFPSSICLAADLLHLTQQCVWYSVDNHRWCCMVDILWCYLKVPFDVVISSDEFEQVLLKHDQSEFDVSFGVLRMIIKEFEKGVRLCLFFEPNPFSELIDFASQFEMLDRLHAPVTSPQNVHLFSEILHLGFDVCDLEGTWTSYHSSSSVSLEFTFEDTVKFVQTAFQSIGPHKGVYVGIELCRTAFLYHPHYTPEKCPNFAQFRTQLFVSFLKLVTNRC